MIQDIEMVMQVLFVVVLVIAIVGIYGFIKFLELGRDVRNMHKILIANRRDDLARRTGKGGHG